jgi:hypothetical protein
MSRSAAATLPSPAGQPRRVPLQLLGALALLGLILAAGVAFLLGLGVLDDELVPIAALEDNRPLWVGISATLGLAATALLFQQLAARNPVDGGAHILSMDAGGSVVVEPGGIARMVRTAILRGSSGAVDATVHVAGRGISPLRLRVRVLIAPGVVLPRAGDEIRAAARDVIREYVGLELQSVHVSLQVATLEDMEKVIA